MICRAHVSLFSVYLVTSSVSIVITTLLFLEPRFASDQKVIFLLLEPSEALLVKIRGVDSLASFGHSLFRDGIDSAEHRAWSSRSFYQCGYVDVESTNDHVLLGGSSLNTLIRVDICGSMSDAGLMVDLNGN